MSVFDNLVCFNKTCLSVLIRCKVKAKVCYFEIVPKYKIGEVVMVGSNKEMRKSCREYFDF